jgi:putative ABC transport system ATP-binding protein
MPPVIRTQDLTRTYVTGKTEVRALRGVSLTIEPGEMVAIMGASFGEVHLMNILGCLDTPDVGHLRA